MRNILITGVCGTIGKTLILKLLRIKKFNKIIGIDVNEEQLFLLESEFQNNKKISFKYCDIKDFETLNEVCYGMDLIFHTAALKHVLFCEESPNQAINTNIKGTLNLIKSSINNSVKKVIFTSSDKAVNPTSVMGTSKLMGEKLFTSYNFKINNKSTIFASVRFGNVIGSSGSFIPLFYNQIKSKKYITITDNNMTRFVMTVNEAIDLMIKSANLAKGGEVFVFKMNAVKISDVADSMIDLYSRDKNIKKKIIGSRPGEKLYEELISDEELRRTNETSKFFIIYPPFFKNISKIKKMKIKTQINSSNSKFISKAMIKKILKQNSNLFSKNSILNTAFSPFLKK